MKRSLLFLLGALSAIAITTILVKYSDMNSNTTVKEDKEKNEA